MDERCYVRDAEGGILYEEFNRGLYDRIPFMQAFYVLIDRMEPIAILFVGGCIHFILILIINQAIKYATNVDVIH